MSLITLIRNGRILRTILPRTSQCLYTTKQDGDAGSKAPTTGAPEPPVQPTAPKPASTPPPEPFDNTQYKSQVYYEHNEYSFYDIEDAMMASRVGQPSSVGHYNQLPQDVLAELERTAKH